MACVLAAASLGTPPARAETGTFDLHLEGGGASFLTEPQTGYFGFGGSVAGSFEWSIVDVVGLEVEYLFAGFPEGDGAYARPDGDDGAPATGRGEGGPGSEQHDRGAGRLHAPPPP
jgi:hypothetical protein